MLSKLAFRNVRRSAKDYLVYFLTMTFVTALMFAFNSLIFTKDIGKMFDIAGPVIVSGVTLSAIVGIIFYLIEVFA